MSKIWNKIMGGMRDFYRMLNRTMGNVGNVETPPPVVNSIGDGTTTTTDVHGQIPIGAPKKVTSGDNVQKFLDFISQAESGGDYNISWVAANKKKDFVPKKNPTEMSLAEVIKWQNNIRKAGAPSTAVGKYQFMHNTLKDIKKALNLTGKERFDEHLQEKMARYLLNRRGLKEYQKGKMDESTFMKNLSMEWAGLPKDMSGAGYYDKDGLNKANLDPKEMLIYLASLR